MPNEKINIVGTNIAEKATMIWNVADMLRRPFSTCFAECEVKRFPDWRT